MNLHLIYDGKKFKARREQLGLGQKEIDGLLKKLWEERTATIKPGQKEEDVLALGSISYKTVSRIENSDPKVTLIYYEFYAKALRRPVEFFRRDPEHDPAEARAWGETLRIMAKAAYDKGREFIAHPYPVVLRPTSIRKITNRSIREDTTLAVDQITSDAMHEALRRLSRKEWHPLSRAGCILIDEELGARRAPDDGSINWKYAVSIDSSDDTPAFMRFLGGTILASVYKFGVGMIAAVGLDFTREILFSRVRGASTEAIKLPPFMDGAPGQSSLDSNPQGSVVTLFPSKLATLANSSICMYLGKAYRIPLAGSRGSRLLDGRTDIAVHSFGGSRGAMLVAEGLVGLFSKAGREP